MIDLTERQVKVRLSCQAIAGLENVSARCNAHTLALAQRQMLHCNRISGYLTRPVQPVVVQP
jgi:hypothetical protein